ncbi:MAG: YeaH/YhbH family protein [Woeseia sp.]
MRHFIDRRLNPKDKNLGNRQRFIRRAKEQIRQKINESIQGRKIADVGSGETISIPTRSIHEPHFRHSRQGGFREGVLGGNKEFSTGDRIRKPQGGQGKGGGKEGADSGEGDDDFQFALTRDEFLDLFFEDLELPDLVKKDLQELHATKPQRAGFTTAGTPTRLAIRRTMRNSLGRRLVLHRPADAELEEVEAEIARIEAEEEDDFPGLEALYARQEALQSRRRLVAFIDPLDIRYRNYQPRPQPNSKAVMFCLMDVSGSMGEREKDLAKRFFILLHLFLQRRYDRIDLVFIRHTHQASVVDEDTFFYSRETGGTVVSSAIVEMLHEIKERYSPREWNIYAAQASDGENFAGDSDYCAKLMLEEVMPQLQYYAYVEILDEREIELFANPQVGAALWRSYRDVAARHDNFAMKRVGRAADIYPVFRELFAKREG